MNPAKVVLGFLPLVAFSLLSTVIGAGGAALVCFGIAVVLIAVGARHGIDTLGVAQAVVLLAIAVLALTGGPAVESALVRYGPALQGLLIGFFMLATAATMPFTARYARSTVPPEVWHSRVFLEVNQRISTAWGLAVFLTGVCHLAGAEIPTSGGHLALRLAVNWVLPVVAFWQAIVYTRRTSAEAHREAQEHVAGGAHEAGPVRS